MSPEQAGADHVAFFGSLAAAEMWGPGMEDGLAAWAAGAAEPDEIEIFLSAGPVDAINSCNVGNQANCRVYRVRWSLSSGAVVGTPDLVSPTWKTTPDPNWTCGFVEPEGEVENGQLAMVRGCLDNASGEMFDLPILDANGVNFESCHHPDWNSDGPRIMCTRHEDEEVADGRLLRQLHEFAYDASSARWVSVGALMAPISLAGVPAEVYPSGACDILTYKYARYVGSNHVLATVFCSTIAADVTGSRVMLIENPTAASPTYHDITTEVEIAVGAAPGSWRGVFGSWGAVS